MGRTQVFVSPDYQNGYDRFAFAAVDCDYEHDCNRQKYSNRNDNRKAF